MTTAPAGLALPLSLMVPIVLLPPATVVGEKVIPITVGGAISVRFAILATVPNVALIGSTTLVNTAEELMVTVAVEAPAGMLTVGG